QYTLMIYGGTALLLVSLFQWAGTPEYKVPVHHEHLSRYSNGNLGMMWFIVSEVGLFAVLISGYVYLRLAGLAVPPVDRPLLALAALNTLLLVSSSFVLHYAEKHLEKGRATRFTLGLFLTLALGSIFFLFQIYEFTLFGSEVDWTGNLWASVFLTLVGLHGLHIVIGAVGVALPYYQILTGKIDKHNHGSIGPASLYWHLVDIVWIVIVVIFYIW
ncbi:MAG: heme-copper oxidase subunit III, partial [Pseudopedobacter sp.]|nr:heme-copper oxidase subunit III [Deinococcales bacterium]